MSVLEKFRLDGKKAFVTGGARGIGLSYAAALAQAGADVAIVDICGGAATASARQLQEETGRSVMAIEADVTKSDQVEAMMEAVLREFGRLDIAFCNAGIAIHKPAEEMSLEDWQRVIDVNLTGVFLTATAAGRQMLKQGSGSIVNTASMSARIVNVPQPQCAYNASKGGVVQLTKSLAVEWAKRNVRVNSISPGYMETHLTVEMPALQAMTEDWKAMTPLRRLGNTEELQAIAVYLASDASLFTTGADFIIDGAYSCI